MRPHSKTPLVTPGPVLWAAGLGVAAGLALAGCSGGAATPGSGSAASHPASAQIGRAHV